MAGQEDQDAQRGSNAVLSWYDRTRPMFIDLVGDYAGKELFLVEGDSLLRLCFEDERIDFQGKPPRTTSGFHSCLNHSPAAWAAISVATNMHNAWYCSISRGIKILGASCSMIPSRPGKSSHI
jgi:hypothetical protein